MAAARAPSGVLLGAFLDQAHAAGRSMEALARKSGAKRQAVARWLSGAMPTKASSRRAIQQYARELLGPLGGSMLAPALAPTLTERVTRELALALGWPAYEGRLPAPPLGLALRSPEHVAKRSAELVGLTLKGLRGACRESRHTAARAAAALVLRRMGYSLIDIAGAIGRGYHTVLYIVNERESGVRS